MWAEQSEYNLDLYGYLVRETKNKTMQASCSSFFNTENYFENMLLNAMYSIHWATLWRLYSHDRPLDRQHKLLEISPPYWWLVSQRTSKIVTLMMLIANSPQEEHYFSEEEQSCWKQQIWCFSSRSSEKHQILLCKALTSIFFFNCKEIITKNLALNINYLAQGGDILYEEMCKFNWKIDIFCM